MINTPIISIIVPIYNVEKYLACCVESLLNQTLTEIEIILVDDESPDNCPALCDEYAKNDHRVKVIHKKNEGQGIARNAGIEIATGEYIAFVDSDDYVELNTYQKVYSIITEKKLDVVFFSYRRFNDHGDIWATMNISKEKLYQTKEEISGLILDMTGNSPKGKFDRDIQGSASCALYRHDLLKMHGVRFISERQFGGEEMPFNMNYLLHCSGAIVIPDTFYNYRLNPLSTSRKQRPDAIVKQHIYYQYLLEMFRVNNFGEDGYSRATRRFLANVRGFICTYVRLSLSRKEKIEWIKEVVNYPYWQEIASSYPYRQLPVLYALHFYLTYKRYYRQLYYFSKLWINLKTLLITLKNLK